MTSERDAALIAEAEYVLVLVHRASKTDAVIRQLAARWLASRALPSTTTADDHDRLRRHLALTEIASGLYDRDYCVQAARTALRSAGQDIEKGPRNQAQDGLHNRVLEGG